MGGWRSLDEVLEGGAVRPLLREGGPVAHGGEVAQTQPLLHAGLPAALLLLGALGNRGVSTNHQSLPHTHRYSLIIFDCQRDRKAGSERKDMREYGPGRN